ncbi:MAG TPA: ATP-grasp domain-containing protein [Rhizomicrobium sp.]|jgi:D-alanine-D-alanine ligase
MRVLVLHSDVPADAPPDEQDTLATAECVAKALRECGHEVVQGAFVPDPQLFDRMLLGTDVVFNLVESVFGRGSLAGIAPAMLEQRGVCFTGTPSIAINSCADKPFTKRVLRAAGLPTPDWSEPPHWECISEDRQYVVKAAAEDSSVGLDDASVVRGGEALRARAGWSVAQHGGIWFAESYCPGREFNVSILETAAGPRVLPIAEIVFPDWQPDRPRLVGYAAKWDTHSEDSMATPRVFGIEKEEPELAQDIARLSLAAWNLFGLRGYARIDFRLDEESRPTILEINPNPCLEREAGFAAAAEKAGLSYANLVERILRVAIA